MNITYLLYHNLFLSRFEYFNILINTIPNEVTLLKLRFDPSTL